MIKIILLNMYDSYHYNKKLIGSFGDISCFSFDGIKNITSGEGGCVVTNDKKIINKIKDYRFLSIVKESEKRYVKKRAIFMIIKKLDGDIIWAI